MKNNSDNFYDLEIYHAFPSYGTTGYINWDAHAGKPIPVIGTLKYRLNNKFPEFNWLIEVNHPYQK